MTRNGKLKKIIDCSNIDDIICVNDYNRIQSYSCKHNEKSIYDNIDKIDLMLDNYAVENEWL